MVDKSKLAEQQARGADADHILNQALVKEAFDGMRARLLSALTETKIDERDARDDYFRMHRAVDQVEACFRMWVRSGDAAGKELLKLKDEKLKD